MVYTTGFWDSCVLSLSITPPSLFEAHINLYIFKSILFVQKDLLRNK